MPTVFTLDDNHRVTFTLDDRITKATQYLIHSFQDDDFESVSDDDSDDDDICNNDVDIDNHDVTDLRQDDVINNNNFDVTEIQDLIVDADLEDENDDECDFDNCQLKVNDVTDEPNVNRDCQVVEDVAVQKND